MVDRHAAMVAVDDGLAQHDIAQPVRARGGRRTAGDDAVRALRKAAAFALVGWYLMMPPWGKLNAPLSEWVVYRSFDSAENFAAAHKVLVDYLANYKGMAMTLITQTPSCAIRTAISSNSPSAHCELNSPPRAASGVPRSDTQGDRD